MDISLIVQLKCLKHAGQTHCFKSLIKVLVSVLLYTEVVFLQKFRKNHKRSLPSQNYDLNRKSVKCFPKDECFLQMLKSCRSNIKWRIDVQKIKVKKML